MAKKRKFDPSKKAAAAKSAQGSPRTFQKWRKYLPAVLLLAVLICYWTPLTAPDTSIQWDAADEFQPGQQYLSDELYAGHLPFWTPYIWAGFPFLADPQVGAWYPLNWPFLLAGPTVHVFVGENLLHALLACFGAYLLAKKLFGNAPAAVFAGLSYGLSGFFAGHSSHTSMFQAAAWLPWLLLLFGRTAQSRAWLDGALAALVAGMIILAGHFQTALYCFAALGLFAIARLITQPREWRRIIAVALAIPLAGTALSAVATFSGLELAANSIRATVSAVTHGEGFLTAGSLVTLLYPNFYNVISGKYSGPSDVTQYYFYASILLLPFAALGLRDRLARRLAGLLIVPCAWYAGGYALGLYYLVARLPGFRSVRAPVHIWFVASLGLSLLAAAGFVWVTTRWRHPWLPVALLGLTCMDLWYWNSEKNPLAYSRASYADTYGAGERIFERAVARSMPPLSRFDAPERIAAFGPLYHPLEGRVEVTYGYNPLMLSRYAEYVAAMRTNPKLRNGLNVARVLDVERSAVVPNPDELPRVTVPEQLIPLSSDEESRRRLPTLDPARQALVPSKLSTVRQDPQATAQVIDYTGSRYRIQYRSATATLLRISAAFFPGWTAHVGGQALEVYPVDHALMGVVVPPGEKILVLEYRSNYFVAGAVISLVMFLACAAIIGRRMYVSSAVSSGRGRRIFRGRVSPVPSGTMD